MLRRQRSAHGEQRALYVLRDAAREPATYDAPEQAAVQFTPAFDAAITPFLLVIDMMPIFRFSLAAALRLTPFYFAAFFAIDAAPAWLYHFARCFADCSPSITIFFFAQDAAAMRSRSKRGAQCP